MTLEEKVRHLIGEEGPQLPTEEYHDRIDEQLKHMTAGELLMRISMALEDDQ